MFVACRCVVKGCVRVDLLVLACMYFKSSYTLHAPVEIPHDMKDPQKVS